MTKRLLTLTLVSLFFITLILRPPIAQIGPVLNQITESLQLSTGQVSFLAAAPVFCFGAGAFIAPWLMRRFGLNHSMFMMLVVLLLAIALRQWFGYWMLVAGTLVIGLAIAVVNVLLPTLLKVDFPKRVTLLTSAYTTVLAASAALSAAISVPVSASLGGWQFGLMAVAIPALLATAFWYPRIQDAEPHVPIQSHAAKADTKQVYGSLIAWSIFAFFGIQSVGFYFTLAWLPTMLISIGIDPTSAGGYLGLATAVGIPPAMALAPLMSKLKRLSWVNVIATFVSIAGYLSLAGFLSVGNPKDVTWLVLSIVTISLGQTSTFPLSIAMISTRAIGESKTTVMSAMTQGLGYLLAGAGTFVFGAISVATGSWSIGILALVVLLVIQIFAGYYGGRDKYLH